MKPSFGVRVLEFAELQGIEDAWTDEHLAGLLERLDAGDPTGMNSEELLEMCVLCLQEQEVEEAAAEVLRHALGERLRNGQIQELAVEMQDVKPWEHFADMSLHERLFDVGSLLYQAFPDRFPVPDAVRVSLEITGLNDAGKNTLRAPLHESFLVRLLADGMEGAAALKRLFEDQLEGNSFPEAEKIVWTVQTEALAENTVRVEIVSSGYWLDALRETRSYSTQAYPDARG